MTIIGKACALAILALPAVARADASDILDEFGVSYSAGTGFSQFTHSAMREHAKEGWAWEARVAFGTRKLLVFELGYLGTLHHLDAVGLDGRANLLGSGLEGVFKIPFAYGRVQPYMLFGAGWRRYDITSTSATTSDMKSSDDVTSYPLGGGLLWKRDRLVFDLRAVYRMAGNVDLLPSVDAQRLDAWSATLTVGFER